MINEPFNLRNDSVFDSSAFGCFERTEKKLSEASRKSLKTINIPEVVNRSSSRPDKGSYDPMKSTANKLRITTF